MSNSACFRGWVIEGKTATGVVFSSDAAGNCDNEAEDILGAVISGDNSVAWLIGTLNDKGESAAASARRSVVSKRAE